MMKNTVRTVLLIMAGLLCVVGANAATQQDAAPVKMLRTTAAQVMGELKSKHASLKTNPTLVFPIVEKILLPHVDVDRMAKMVLGRQVWMEITPEQRQAFTDEFIHLIIGTYSSALAAYTDETLKFFPLRDDPAKAKRLQVDSQIVRRSGPSVALTYRLIKTAQGWMVYDLIVEGISLIQSYQSQFSAEINQYGFKTMLLNLKKHNA